ncbi:hypothetical protein BKA64DRAFT_658422 [Cadophora sp. MPI-SDFR-AT-0126]|nr:hypothetical protein BKA64DRAFT_658422 [Leotiomycetes sp. MPI-SDFR-AT-0126]
MRSIGREQMVLGLAVHFCSCLTALLRCSRSICSIVPAPESSPRFAQRKPVRALHDVAVAVLPTVWNWTDRIDSSVRSIYSDEPPYYSDTSNGLFMY